MYQNGLLLSSDIMGTNFYQDATGRINEGLSILLKTIKVGDLILQNVMATVIKNANAPLLFGQSAIAKFEKFEFDYTNNTLTIKGKRTLNFLDGNILNQDKKKKYYVYNYEIDADEINTTTGKLKKETIVYNRPYSDSVAFKLKPNESFSRIKLEKHIYQMSVLKIVSFTRPNDFPDCPKDKIKIGDLIFLLWNHGEGSHEVILNNKIIFINAFYDHENNGMGEGGYEGCNNVTGKFIESKEISIVWMKIKTSTGKVGYLKNPKFNDFVDQSCFAELNYEMTEGL
jgi:hypothetical protein